MENTVIYVLLPDNTVVILPSTTPIKDIYGEIIKYERRK